jgi:hypothetical protein
MHVDENFFIETTSNRRGVIFIAEDIIPGIEHGV